MPLVIDGCSSVTPYLTHTCDALVCGRVTIKADACQCGEVVFGPNRLDNTGDVFWLLDGA